MNKKIVIGVVSVALLIGGGVFLKVKKGSIDRQVKEQLDNLNSYHVEANMEMLVGDEMKTYKVDVDYLKNETDLFKVSIYDKVLNQSQVILRNNDGVFVCTPSLNQVYQFKSEWPFNSEKPYIYQTLLNYFNQEHEQNKKKDGIVLNSAVVYPHDETIKTQEIRFNKNLIPEYVSVFDDSGVEKIHVEFTKFEVNQNVDIKTFEVTTQQTETPTGSFEDYPLLPLELFGTKLASQEKCSINGYTTHILQFTGEKSFTLVETLSDEKSDVEVVATSGELIDLVGGVAILENQELKFFYPGMTCSVYSDNMTQLEMIEVVNSLQMEVLK